MHEINSEFSVRLMGDVNDENIGRITEEIVGLNGKNKEEWITLYITSGGGIVPVALAFYEYIVGVLKPKLQTIVLGIAESAAPVIFLTGEYRIIGSYARLFFHEIGRSYEGPKRFTNSSLKEILLDIETDTEIFAEIAEIKTNGKTDRKKMKDLMRSRVSFSAKEAVEMGFAHEILSK